MRCNYIRLLMSIYVRNPYFQPIEPIKTRKVEFPFQLAVGSGHVRVASVNPDADIWERCWTRQPLTLHLDTPPT